MRRVLPAFCLLSVSLLAVSLLAGCSRGAGDGIGGFRGIILTERGAMVQTPANARKDAVERLTEAITKDLGPEWRAQVAVKEFPYWIEPKTETDFGEWRWKQVTVLVDLVGSGRGPAADTARYEATVRDFFAGRMARKGVGLSATVAAVTDPSRFAAIAGPQVQPLVVTTATAPAPAMAPALPRVAVAWPKSYTVQPGDTLGDISALHYGSTTSWRRIIAANPGLDPAALKPGQVLVIPAPE